MKRVLNLCLLIFCLTIATQPLYAQEGDEPTSLGPATRFAHLTTADGLANAHVEVIFQDSRGFMWFGTRDGLSRYDGYHFSAYRHNPDDPNSLSGNGQAIANGDTSPSAADDTDFGVLTLWQILSHTFIISSDGELDLTLGSLGLDEGTHFTMTQPASTTLQPGQSAAFTLTFDPQSVGTFSDTVTLANNDPDENPFTFVISGTGNCPASIYVDRDANGNRDGTSWTDAYTDLQDGLTVAPLCTPIEIWVASGVYTPGLSQSDTFTLTSGIALYGGFVATETLRSQRNYTDNLTILSGDISGDDTIDSNGVVTSTDNISGSNSYHVVWADGVNGDPITETTVLDGFTITAGQANGSGDNGNGGGFYCDGQGSGNECSPGLSNITFSGNYAFISN